MVTEDLVSIFTNEIDNILSVSSISTYQWDIKDVLHDGIEVAYEVVQRPWPFSGDKS